jgi:hypothetical protein
MSYSDLFLPIRGAESWDWVGHAMQSFAAFKDKGIRQNSIAVPSLGRSYPVPVASNTVPGSVVVLAVKPEPGVEEGGGLLVSASPCVKLEGEQHSMVTSAAVAAAAREIPAIGLRPHPLAISGSTSIAMRGDIGYVFPHTRTLEGMYVRTWTCLCGVSFVFWLGSNIIVTPPALARCLCSSYFGSSGDISDGDDEDAMSLWRRAAALRVVSRTCELLALPAGAAPCLIDATRHLPFTNGSVDGSVEQPVYLSQQEQSVHRAALVSMVLGFYFGISMMISESNISQEQQESTGRADVPIQDVFISSMAASAVATNSSSHRKKGSYANSSVTGALWGPVLLVVKAADFRAWKTTLTLFCRLRYVLSYCFAISHPCSIF